MGYAFISYSSKNQSYANSIKEFLNKQNVSTWMAPGDIPPGSRYAEIITKAVRECSCMVLVLSNDSQNSIWVANEVERALNFKKTGIPVKIEDMSLNDEFDFYIGSSQIVALQKIDSQLPEVQTFLKSVVTLTGQQSTPVETNPVPFPNDKKDPEPNNENTPQKELQSVGAVFSIGTKCADFLNSLNGNDRKTLTNGMGDRLLDILQIPKLAKVYFAHDDTLMHSGKNGFAVWENGISTRQLWSETDFISWQEFCKKGAKIRTDLNTTSGRTFISAQGTEKYLGYLTGNPALLPLLNQFFVDLQNGLRETSGHWKK